MKLFIRLKLLIGFTLFLLIATIVQGFVFLITREYISSQISSLQTAEVTRGTNEIQKFFTELNSESTGLAQSYKKNPQDITPAAAYIINNNDFIKKITILSPFGKELEKFDVFGQAQPDSLTYEVYSDPFNSAVSGHSAISKMYYVEEGSAPHLDLFTPIFNSQASVAGIIKMQVNLNQLRNELSDIRMGEDGYIYVVDNEGRLIAHASEKYVLERPNLSNRKIIANTLAGKRSSPEDELYVNEKNVHVVSKAIKVPGLNWVAVFEQPEADAFSFLVIMKNLFIITLAGSTFFLLLIALFLSENLTRPLRKLQRSAQQIIESGRLERTVIIESGDEIESLSKSFAVMTDQLVQRERWLEKVTMQLNDANSKLQELDKAKTEFVSIASHELRTPMTAVKSYLSMALDDHISGPLSEKQRYYIDRAYVSSDRLIQMVNDMLNISRIESGRLSINIQAVDIEKIIREVVDDVQARANELGVTVSFVGMGNPPPPVLADTDKIKEVVFNLIGNSLKFTPRGGVITVALSQKDAMVEVKISDTGVGISSEDLSKLFQKFGLLPNSYAANPSAIGTGLGLYICKSIIEMHEGTIKANSAGPGKGSEFTFTLKTFNEPDMQRLSAKYTHNSENAVDLIHSQI